MMFLVKYKKQSVLEASYIYKYFKYGISSHMGYDKIRGFRRQILGYMIQYNSKEEYPILNKGLMKAADEKRKY